MVGWMGWTQGQPPPPLAPGLGAPPRSGDGESDLAPGGDPGRVTSGGGCLEGCCLTRAGPRSSQGLGTLRPSAGSAALPGGRGLPLPWSTFPLRPEAPAQCGSLRKAPFVPPRMCFQRLPLETRSHFLPLFPSWPGEAGGGESTDSGVAAALGALPSDPRSCLVREA